MNSSVHRIVEVIVIMIFICYFFGLTAMAASVLIQ